MKRPTQAAWVRMFKAFEPAFNALQQESLSTDDIEALYRIHDMLRRRASGADTEQRRRE